MTRPLAWKPRCASIMFVNSCARSTFDISSEPAASVPRPFTSPGTPTTGLPEFGDWTNFVPATRWRPCSFGNFASVSCESVTDAPVTESM